VILSKKEKEMFGQSPKESKTKEITSKNSFMGCMNASFALKFPRFARHCKVFVISVKVLLVLSSGCSACHFESLVPQLSGRVREKDQDTIPFRRPKSFGVKTAGQKNRRKKNPLTVVYCVLSLPNFCLAVF